MLSNLEELLAAPPAKSAKHAKNDSNAGLDGGFESAKPVLNRAKNQGEVTQQEESLAALANFSTVRISPEPAPVKDLSNISTSSRGSTRKNQFCSEDTFRLYGLGFSQSEQAMGNLERLYFLAVATGAGDEVARDFAEAAALFAFMGDGRKACIECRYYSHKWGTQHGTCHAAGVPPLQHMRKGGLVNFHWLNRCAKHDRAGA